MTMMQYTVCENIMHTHNHTHRKSRVTGEVPVRLSNASLRDKDVNVTRTTSA